MRRSPRRLLGHLLVLLAVSAMIVAGVWQLHRLSERRQRNSQIDSRSEQPVVTLQDLLQPDAGYAQGTELEYRRVRITGEYQAAEQVLVRNRTYEGSAGFWVLTPLRTGPDEAVAVNRGWIPFALDIGEVAPPAGSVTVTGAVRATVTASGLQQADPSDGVLTDLARPDLARLDRQTAQRLAPVYVQLQTQLPAAQELPIPVPLPDLDEGPHLAYAVQWFIFATVATVGYPLILRRTRRPVDPVGDSSLESAAGSAGDSPTEPAG